MPVYPMFNEHIARIICRGSYEGTRHNERSIDRAKPWSRLRVIERARLIGTAKQLQPIERLLTQPHMTARRLAGCIHAAHTRYSMLADGLDRQECRAWAQEPAPQRQAYLSAACALLDFAAKPAESER